MSLIVRTAPSVITLATVLTHLPRTAHSRFPEMVAASWEASTKYKIDSAGMAAQMAIETGWGNFPGQARPEFHNPCGLKWHDTMRRLYPELMAGDMPLAHAVFANWRAGCEAHAQHVLAYTLATLPLWQVNLDPRYQAALAEARDRLGRAAVEWRDLGGMWAPNPAYGEKIETVRQSLITGTYGVR